MPKFWTPWVTVPSWPTNPKIWDKRNWVLKGWPEWFYWTSKRWITSVWIRTSQILKYN